MPVDPRRRLAGRIGLPAAIVFTAIACRPSPHVVSTGGAGSYEAALAVLPEGLVAAWYDTRDGNAEIYVREIDGAGEPRGPERRLTASPEASYEVSVDALGPALAVAWYDKAADGTLSATLGVRQASGAEVWTVPLGPRTRNPVVRTHADKVLCAWIAAASDGREAVWAGWWDAQGRQAVLPVRVGDAGRTTWNVNAAIDRDGAGWIVYDATAGTQAEELFVGRVDAHGAASSARVSVDDGRASKYPDVAIEGDRVALTWYDQRDGNAEVYLATGTRTDVLAGIDARATRVTETAGESIGAYVAMHRGRIGLAWSDDTPGQFEVYFRAFDAGGRPLGPAQRVTDTAASSLIPAIRPWRDGFALLWNEYSAPTAPGDGHGGRSRIAFAFVR